MTRPIALCAALLAAAALSACAHSSAATTTATTANTVPLAVAAFGTFTAHVHAQGRVGAPAGSDAKLSFAGSGLLARVDVHVGETVAAGQALAELDTSGLEIDLRQARADAAAAAASYGGGSVPSQSVASAQRRLDAARGRLTALSQGDAQAQSDAQSAASALRQAQAKVAADEQTVAREQSLYSGGVAAQKDVQAAQQQLVNDRADVDAATARARTATAGISGAAAQARADVAQAQSDVRAAQAQVGVTAGQSGSAQARVAAAQRNLANAVLRAPADGIVTQILKRPGEAIDPTQPALVVGPPSSQEVTVAVPGDIARTIRPGQPVTVALPARNLRASGVVRSVVASVDPTTQTGTIIVGGVPDGAASGDAVDVTIAAAPRRGIIIPTAAIVEDPQTGRSVVFVRQRGKDGSATFVSREIDVAASDATSALVSGGLRAGERIASRGAFDLLAPAGGG